MLQYLAWFLFMHHWTDHDPGTRVVKTWVEKFNAAGIEGLTASYAPGVVFVQMKNGLIVFQRGYIDQLTFFRLQGIPIPNKYLQSR